MRALKNPLKSAICLRAFIERVKYPGMSCIMPGLGCMPSYLQLTFIDSSRHKLEGVVTTRSSREESSTFCTSTSISFTSGKHYTPNPLPLATRLPLSRVVSALRRLESMRVHWTWMLNMIGFCNCLITGVRLQLCRFKIRAKYSSLYNNHI